MLPRFALDRSRLPTLDRSGVALISGAMTGLAGLLALLVVALLGASPITFIIGLLLLGLAMGGGVLVGRMADRSFTARIAALRGLPHDGETEGRDFERESVETVVADLLHRLDRAGQVRTAFATLSHPALLTGPMGVMAATRGLEQAIPGGLAALDLTAIEEGAELVAIGLQRFHVRRTAAGAGRMVVELLPAGQFVSDEDCETFTEGLAGHGARFSAAAVAGSAVVAAMQEALGRIDATVTALDRMAAGMFEKAPTARMPEATRRLVERLARLMAEMGEARDAAETQAARLEQRLGSVETALGVFSESVAHIAEDVEAGRDAIGAVEARLEEARAATERWTRIEREAVLAASDAAMAIRGGAVDAIEPLLDQLSAHLENLGNEAGIIATMLGDGKTTLGQVGEVVERIGAEAERGLVRGARRRVA